MGNDQDLEQMILDTTNQCDGMEVPRDMWEIAEKLVAEGRIESLGPACGPGGNWKRAYPVNTDVD